MNDGGRRRENVSEQERQGGKARAQDWERETYRETVTHRVKERERERNGGGE